MTYILGFVGEKSSPFGAHGRGAHEVRTDVPFLGFVGEKSSPFGAHGISAHEVRSTLGYVGEKSSPFGAHGRGAHDVRSFLGSSNLGYVGEKSSPFGAHGINHEVRSFLGGLGDVTITTAQMQAEWDKKAVPFRNMYAAYPYMLKGDALEKTVAATIGIRPDVTAAKQKAELIAIAKAKAKLQAEAKAMAMLILDQREGVPSGTNRYRAMHNGENPPGFVAPGVQAPPSFGRPEDGGALPPLPALPGEVVGAGGDKTMLYVAGAAALGIAAFLFSRSR